jgi:hypothetical protein
VWLTLTDAAGRKLLNQLFEPGTRRTINLAGPATLRTGNAGGLAVALNGKPIGPIGPTGHVRDIVFEDGASRVVPAQ